MADRRLAKLIAFASLVAVAAAYNASTPEPSPLTSTALLFNVTLNRTADPSSLPTTDTALQNSSRYDPDQNNSTASNSSRTEYPDHPGAVNRTTAAGTPENSTLPQVPDANVTVVEGNVTHDWLLLSTVQPTMDETDLVLRDVDGAKGGPSEAEDLDEAEEPEMLPIKQDADNADDANNIEDLRSVLGKDSTDHVPVVEDTTKTSRFHVPVVEDTSAATGKTPKGKPTPHVASTKTSTRGPATESSASTISKGGQKGGGGPESTTMGAVSVSSSFLTPLVLLATLLFLH